MPARDTVLQTGKLDPHYPKVCGHRGNVLDIKWNPFDDFEIASCSEDATVSARQRNAGAGRGRGMEGRHPNLPSETSPGFDFITLD